MDNQQSGDDPGKIPQAPKLLSGFSCVLCVAAVIGNVIAIYLLAPRG